VVVPAPDDPVTAIMGCFADMKYPVVKITLQVINRVLSLGQDKVVLKY
jgi:hypothetical protein